MSEHANREQELFLQAIDLPDESSRNRLLDGACADDPALRARIELLLRNTAEAGTFFDDAPTLAAPAELLDQPTLVDRYRLLRRIGQGSCGVVYLAEQLEPVRREVALKIIRLGTDTAQVIARFALERQALALMDHPHIARVYDAGETCAGRPYFVMEHVSGEPLIAYCDRHALALEARLSLFVQICDAVAHAHCRGIVHRDIKPANILVASDEGRPPAPKLIDFGIAKAIDHRIAFRAGDTQATQIIGTPAYMSPEQVAGDARPVDTRSDIYSLGALLCELLVGQTPFTQKQLTQHGLPGLVKTLLEVEPPRPSALFAALPEDEKALRARLRAGTPAEITHRLRQDLDWIVLKAIEKSPEGRYENARALADDILRVGRNQPVSARPPSRAYLLRKLVHRHRVVFLAALLVALTLVVGTATTTWLYLRERRALQAQVQLREQAELARAAEAELRLRAEAVAAFSSAAVQLRHGKIAEAEVLVARVPPTLVPPSLESADVLRELGQSAGLAGDWERAAARFLDLAHVIIQTDDSDSDRVSRDLVLISAALGQHGAPADFAAFRRLTLARFADTAHPVVAEHLVKCNLLFPAPPELVHALRAPAAVAESSLHPEDPLADPEPYLAAWRCIALALYHHRVGTEPAIAAQWAQRSLRYPAGNPSLGATASALLAMIHRSQGDIPAARAALARARALIPAQWTYPLPRGDVRRGSWSAWIQAGLLLREAAEQLDEGTFLPETNTPERVPSQNRPES